MAGAPASMDRRSGERRCPFHLPTPCSQSPRRGRSRRDGCVGQGGPWPWWSYSGLVLRSPMTRSPSFHCPRFLRTSTRSKRFMTLRLAAEADAERKLGCCDIIFSFDTVFAYRPGSRDGREFLARIPPACQCFIRFRADYQNSRTGGSVRIWTTCPFAGQVGPEFAKLVKPTTLAS
jgi:hypothetical protein